METWVKVVQGFLGSFLGQAIGDFGILLKDEIRFITKKILAALGSLFLSGLSLAYLIDRLLKQLDQGEFSYTHSIILLSVTFVLGLVFFFWALSAKKWQTQIRHKEQGPSEPSPLETAVSILILDWVKEREEKRDLKKEEGPKLEEVK